MQLQASNRCHGEGQRTYPSPSLEIFLLTQATQRAKLREADDFKQLISQYGWALTRTQHAAYLRALAQGTTLVLTDTRKVIQWTSHSFLAMTGYTTAEAVGYTARLLQGANTSVSELARIREQLKQGDIVKADLVNYRKSGEAYLCRLTIDPLHTRSGELTHFLAVESEIKPG